MSEEEMAERIFQLEKELNIKNKEKDILQNKYDKLVHFSIEVCFSEFNDDVELLLRLLNKQGIIEEKNNMWINPFKDNPNLVNEKEIEKKQKWIIEGENYNGIGITN